MSRLAWFTPLPPARSGIAAYSAELLPRLLPEHDIDVFVDQPAPGGLSAHDFIWKNLRDPYDLVVYQLGNAACHDYLWPYLARYPGLVVLHDGQLHHSRARALLTRQRADDYREEFRFSHPDAPVEIADLVIATLAGSLYYLWPMLGVAVRSARCVAVHAPRLAEQLRTEFPGAAIETIRMGVSDPRLPGTDSLSRMSAADVRARHNIPGDAMVFAAFGGVTPEKRISQTLRALAAISPYAPHAALMLVGDTADYYDVRAAARRVGVTGRIRVTGYVADEDLAAYVDAADVCVCLRWPTTRETSASWLRCLAAGRPTIITDLTHNDEVASLDPRTWTTLPAAVAPGSLPPGEAEPAVCVSVDLLDEEHSLALAMRRLELDNDLRAELGQCARAWWARTHTLDVMVSDYRRVLAQALKRPLPAPVVLPAHFRADGTELARQVTAELGVTVDFLA
ncbi:MAG: glycosyltransferase family 4 protein [Planctomycetes bacterium]|nr:glycosyltransferase family 4 protein [Planctomycetota bacterium]